MSNIIKQDHPLTRKELFNKYKLNNKIFFETGTHKGDSIQTALDLNFDKILSVELIHSLFSQCCYRFIDEPNVKLFHGNSSDKMSEMLDLIDSQTLFWLDGHVDGVNADCLWDELEHIKSHNIKTHTIIVDDIPLYFGDGEKVKSKILEINPNYQFIIEDALNEGNGECMQGWDLIAFIP